eukprot:TRINITY_DN6187_c1_g2_i2.p1 TRINITY_DN6187_c1_g2~~TRINITY_DN6187_c1_g2_i2.p1  ORF type:complete len:153 (-),score=12.92 TRINITY_DN6187_c1_g2_i2:216-674(-)
MTIEINLRTIIAEFIATTIFLFIGCGTVMTYLAPPNFQYKDQVHNSDPSYLPHTNSMFGIIVPFVFGITVMVLAYSTEQFDAGHLNPAVTIGLLISKKTNFYDAVLMILAQVSGSLIAMLFLKGTVPNAEDPTIPFSKQFQLSLFFTKVYKG